MEIVPNLKKTRNTILYKTGGWGGRFTNIVP